MIYWKNMMWEVGMRWGNHHPDNRNRASGMYGTAIIGNGIRCKARKSELLEAIQRHELTEREVR